MNVRRRSPVVATLRLCLYALLAGLLLLAALRSGDNGHPTAVVVSVLVTGAVLAAGAVGPAVHRSRRTAAVWVAALSASWLVLVAFSPDGLWVAFPLYFLQLHLLPVRWSLPAVALTAGAAIASFVAHGAPLTPGAFIGPPLGAAVAVATVLGYEALYRESERRRELIEELIAARAELAEAERAAGTLAERERLAREIHDTLAQGLSSIQLLLRAAQRLLPADSPAAPHLEQARSTAQDNLAEARRFVRALTPPDLEHGSLAAALERLCRSAAVDTPKVRFSVSGPPVELPTPYEVALLRIAQSALGNTLRHARADRAEITLSFMDTAVALDVVDDGVGFTPGGVRPAGDRTEADQTEGDRTEGGQTEGDRTEGGQTDGGFGLPAMRSRAESLGGTFTVESAPGQGTAVAVTLPLPVTGEPPETVSLDADRLPLPSAAGSRT
ncbi:sensor histidine kinase [Streptomyces rhizosphaerihabitans]|uniref:sensor histidine kinase n=1 Tax=Streptomyces rhizosphaerihabitans TaxID=1266770 RepID=UPI0021C07F5F|nr:sensor histidine kinase [Streptomyces rhizosphaerihabitans]MCT9006175.1 sensor histidine kinase [Streptomyces rhizosphaerihabitans]